MEKNKKHKIKRINTHPNNKRLMVYNEKNNEGYNENYNTQKNDCIYSDNEYYSEIIKKDWNDSLNNNCLDPEYRHKLNRIQRNNENFSDCGGKHLDKGYNGIEFEENGNVLFTNKLNLSDYEHNSRNHHESKEIYKNDCVYIDSENLLEGFHRKEINTPHNKCAYENIEEYKRLYYDGKIVNNEENISKNDILRCYREKENFTGTACDCDCNDIEENIYNGYSGMLITLDNDFIQKNGICYKRNPNTVYYEYIGNDNKHSMGYYSEGEVNFHLNNYVNNDVGENERLYTERGINRTQNISIYDDNEVKKVISNKEELNCRENVCIDNDKEKNMRTYHHKLLKTDKNDCKDGMGRGLKQIKKSDNSYCITDNTEESMKGCYKGVTKAGEDFYDQCMGRCFQEEVKMKSTHCFYDNTEQNMRLLYQGIIKTAAGDLYESMEIAHNKELILNNTKCNESMASYTVEDIERSNYVSGSNYIEDDSEKLFESLVNVATNVCAYNHITEDTDSCLGSLVKVTENVGGTYNNITMEDSVDYFGSLVEVVDDAIIRDNTIEETGRCLESLIKAANSECTYEEIERDTEMFHLREKYYLKTKSTDNHFQKNLEECLESLVEAAHIEGVLVDIEKKIDQTNVETIKIADSHQHITTDNSLVDSCGQEIISNDKHFTHLKEDYVNTSRKEQEKKNDDGLKNFTLEKTNQFNEDELYSMTKLDFLKDIPSEVLNESSHMENVNVDFENCLDSASILVDATSNFNCIMHLSKELDENDLVEIDNKEVIKSNLKNFKDEDANFEAFNPKLEAQLSTNQPSLKENTTAKTTQYSKEAVLPSTNDLVLNKCDVKQLSVLDNKILCSDHLEAIEPSSIRKIAQFNPENSHVDYRESSSKSAVDQCINQTPIILINKNENFKDMTTHNTEGIANLDCVESFVHKVPVIFFHEGCKSDLIDLKSKTTQTYYLQENSNLEINELVQQNTPTHYFEEKTKLDTNDSLQNNISTYYIEEKIKLDTEKPMRENNPIYYLKECLNLDTKESVQDNASAYYLEKNLKYDTQESHELVGLIPSLDKNVNLEAKNFNDSYESTQLLKDNIKSDTEDSHELARVIPSLEYNVSLERKEFNEKEESTQLLKTSIEPKPEEPYGVACIAPSHIKNVSLESKEFDEKEESTQLLKTSIEPKPEELYGVACVVPSHIKNVSLESKEFNEKEESKLFTKTNNNPDLKEPYEAVYTNNSLAENVDLESKNLCNTENITKFQKESNTIEHEILLTETIKGDTSTVINGHINFLENNNQLVNKKGEGLLENQFYGRGDLRDKYLILKKYISKVNFELDYSNNSFSNSFDCNNVNNRNNKKITNLDLEIEAEEMYVSKERNSDMVDTYKKEICEETYKPSTEEIFIKENNLKMPMILLDNVEFNKFKENENMLYGNELKVGELNSIDRKSGVIYGSEIFGVSVFDNKNEGEYETNNLERGVSDYKNSIKSDTNRSSMTIYNDGIEFKNNINGIKSSMVDKKDKMEINKLNENNEFLFSSKQSNIIDARKILVLDTPNKKRNKTDVELAYNSESFGLDEALSIIDLKSQKNELSDSICQYDKVDNFVKIDKQEELSISVDSTSVISTTEPMGCYGQYENGKKNNPSNGFSQGSADKINKTNSINNVIVNYSESPTNSSCISNIYSKDQYYMHVHKSMTTNPTSLTNYSVGKTSLKTSNYKSNFIDEKPDGSWSSITSVNKKRTNNIYCENVNKRMKYTTKYNGIVNYLQNNYKGIDKEIFNDIKTMKEGSQCGLIKNSGDYGVHEGSHTDSNLILNEKCCNASKRSNKQENNIKSDATYLIEPHSDQQELLDLKQKLNKQQNSEELSRKSSTMYRSSNEKPIKSKHQLDKQVHSDELDVVCSIEYQEANQNDSDEREAVYDVVTLESNKIQSSNEKNLHKSELNYENNHNCLNKQKCIADINLMHINKVETRNQSEIKSMKNTNQHETLNEKTIVRSSSVDLMNKKVNRCEIADEKESKKSSSLDSMKKIIIENDEYDYFNNVFQNINQITEERNYSYITLPMQDFYVAEPKRIYLLKENDNFEDFEIINFMNDQRNQQSNILKEKNNEFFKKLRGNYKIFYQRLLDSSIINYYRITMFDTSLDEISRILGNKRTQVNILSSQNAAKNVDLIHKKKKEMINYNINYGKMVIDKNDFQISFFTYKEKDTIESPEMAKYGDVKFTESGKVYNNAIKQNINDKNEKMYSSHKKEVLFENTKVDSSHNIKNKTCYDQQKINGSCISDVYLNKLDRSSIHQEEQNDESFSLSIKNQENSSSSFSNSISNDEDILTKMPNKYQENTSDLESKLLYKRICDRPTDHNLSDSPKYEYFHNNNSLFDNEHTGIDITHSQNNKNYPYENMDFYIPKYNVIDKIYILNDTEWNVNNEKVFLENFRLKNFKYISERTKKPIKETVLHYYRTKRTHVIKLKKKVGRISDREMQTIVKKDWNERDLKKLENMYSEMGKDWLHFQTIFTNKHLKSIKLAFRFLRKKQKELKEKNKQLTLGFDSFNTPNDSNSLQNDENENT